MFIRASILALPLVGLVAVANAAPSSEAIVARDSPSTNQCNTGAIQCCNQTFDVIASSVTGSLLDPADILAGVEGIVGLNCSPIASVLGGGSTCQQQPICCTGNTYNGLINVGCSPVNIYL
ncbi:fungal hydrophobin [Gyrodon lividus]|nr:fungal hydrophobin [Gyrodon lividus]